MKITPNSYYIDMSSNVTKHIPSASVDLIIADLPYYKVVDEEWDNQWKSVDSYLKWVDELCVEYRRVLKPNRNLFIFTSRQLNRKINLILDKYFFEKRIIIWARKRGFNNTRGKHLASGYEPISFYTNDPTGAGIFNSIKIPSNNKRKEYTDGILKGGVSLSDVWLDIPALPHNSKEKVNHKTQKPLKLISRCIEIGSNPGMLVLDNVAGSGTTGVSCKKMNRDYLLIEKDSRYEPIIQTRLNTIT